MAVLAYSRPAALLAPASSVVVLADARPAAVLAHASFAVVIADARAADCLHILNCRRCSQVLDPSHCQHWLFWRLCGHFARFFFAASPQPCYCLKGGYVYLSLVMSQGGRTLAKEGFNPCIRVDGFYHRVNDSKLCSFYSQDFLSFDFLSRDWTLKLDANNFRN